MTKSGVEQELTNGHNLSIIKLVDNLIEYAHSVRASDIHLDPDETGMRVRLRIDGVLDDTFTFPKQIRSEVISRIKVMSGMRTDEHQVAQDGRFRSIFEDIGAIDIRVSIAPTYFGENAVLRLLSDKSEQFTLDTLGFSASDKDKITKAIHRSHGMILSTGPTGSGKTTTLYTLIKVLNKPGVSITTVEDPIEYAVEGINQIQVNPRTGLSFSNGLRSILRQDPDIIMVGEIRDSETASIAVNTSLTGHLLLSTLHTNDSATTLPRLLDMGIEPYLIASTVNIVIGQRLVRKLCGHCKTKKTLTATEHKSLESVLSASDADIKHSYHGEGCDKCNTTGYCGRLGIYEVMLVDGEIREAFLRKSPSGEIKAIARANGMTTMIEDGLKKAEEGLTTIEEVLRVINE